MIVLDAEIKKAILGRGETRIEGIEYCEGWRDFEGMGIACVCTYDTDTHLSRVFLEEDLVELAAYIRGKHTAGFNTRRFDLQLLARYGITPDESWPLTRDWAWTEPHYDILEEIWLALGLNPGKFSPRTHGGWGLDAVGQATLGIAKTGHGALAPVWWQQGKRGKVIDYCLNDCHMEAQILMHICEGKPLTNGKDTVQLKIPDWAWKTKDDLQRAQLVAQGKGACPESRYDISGDHAWGSNGHCRDCGAQRPTTVGVPGMNDYPSDELSDTSGRSPGGLGIIR